MTAEQYQKLHTDLGFSFDLYVASHLDSPWHQHLTDETMLVFQTDDPDFNAWAWQFAKRCRARDDRADRPITLIYVPVPNLPSVEGVAWEQAKVLARFVMKPEPELAQAAT